jgi:hypothetical protein
MELPGFQRCPPCSREGAASPGAPGPPSAVACRGSEETRAKDLFASPVRCQALRMSGRLVEAERLAETEHHVHVLERGPGLTLD